MTKAEMVTDFTLEGKTVDEVIQALREHCKGLLEDCDDFGLSPDIQYGAKGARVPDRYRWVVAFAVEGESEGWYVHVGCQVPDQNASKLTGLAVYQYVDWGFAKVWSADSAYALAREAQRFLSAARWG